MDEPIAIIGLDAKFPGEGDTAERFYESLVARRSARTEVPQDRYNAEAFWHPDGERSGSTRARCGHYLKDNIAAFDAPFFSITPAEARSMDPQQRGMLESVYKALENAGLPLTAVAGSQTGVYVGCFTADYNEITVKDLDMPSKYAATGTVASMLSNRVSWFFDFRGPSITIDTACSSSLVAAHEACMSLKLREISMAVVGGCNLILSPEMTLKLGAAGVLGPDGKSYSFDHRGNGYARGEGFGVLVLKRVSDAIRDGDVIRAVIRNSSTNQDGRSPGITQPTRAAQAQLIRHVYNRAGLDPSLTRFFEAHGTGTPVGDPIEASAIGEIFSPYRSPEEPLYVGALKSNVGHLEGAAGVAAMIKGVFTLEQGVIPPNMWFEKANPKIEESWNLKFPTEPTVWPQTGIRRMSINSFGIGGSNAHVVMDDACNFLQKYHLLGKHRTVIYPKIPQHLQVALNGEAEAKGPQLIPENGTNGTNGTNGANGRHDDNNSDPRTPQLIPLSSHDQDGVARVKEVLNQYITPKNLQHIAQSAENQLLRDLSNTLTSRRTHHSWRSFSLAKNLSQVQDAWSTVDTPVRTKAEPKLAFIFTGQGAQWPAMGVDLMAYPVFQQSVFAADRYLNNLGCGWSLTYELSKDGGASKIDDPEYCQPICTALQVALVDLLATWNIYAHAITGHSSGEVAAAYAAGAISQEAAWKVAYYRGKLSARLCDSETGPKTGMAAVGLDLEATKTSIAKINEQSGGGTLEIACMNSWNSHTVSGDSAKIDALVEMLSADKIFARRLNVKIAYHSQYMKAMADEYLKLMGELEPGTKKLPFKPRFCSSVLGTTVSNDKLRDPSYWVQNLVSPVRFCESVTQLLDGSSDGASANGNQEPALSIITDVLEIGPHSALKGPFINIAKKAQKSTVEYHSVLKRNTPGVMSALEAAGSLFCRGYDIDLQTINENGDWASHKPLMLTDLPAYPFNHSKQYWAESKRSRDFRLRSVGRHELLGAPSLDWNPVNAVWHNYIRISENPWIEDHKVSGDVLYPAAGMLVMAVEASRQMADPSKIMKGFRFKDVSFHSALAVLDEAEGVESQFCMRPHRETSLPGSSTWNEFQLFTVENGNWKENCRGFIQTEYQSDEAESEDVLALAKQLEDFKLIQSSCKTQFTPQELYKRLHESGLDFGSTFQTMSNIRAGPDRCIVGNVNSTVDKIKERMPYKYIHHHLVHPATLDGVIHANLAPFVLESSKAHPTRVPIYAEELWISAGPADNHDSYEVAAQACVKGRDEAKCTVTAFHPTSRNVMVQASGLVFKALPASTETESSDATKHGAFNIEWKPDPTFMSKEDATQAFGLSMSPGDDPSDWMVDCEALCLAYIRQYLSTVTAESAEQLDWHHKKYLSWMRHVEESSIGKETISSIKELEEKVSKRGTPEGTLIMAVGQAMNEMLGGPRDPLDVIFGDKIAENVYRHGLGSKRCYVQLCNYIDALVHKHPKMRILEIGAGTGGATRPVMETLSQLQGQRYQHYTFTDISPSFFEQAREIFQDQLDNMSFKVLNVESSPTDQGFEAGSYDLIIAANVLHATKKIETTLQNARELLKPGGKLLLFEITSPEIRLGTFCFGVLPGWWLSEDPDRVWGPLMSADSWNTHLVNSGFTGVDMAFQDFPGSAHQMSSILVSSVPEKIAPSPVETEPVQSETTQNEPTHKSEDTIYALIDDESSAQKALAEQIIQRFAGSSHEVIGITTAIDKDLSNSTCVMLAELDKPLLSDIKQPQFECVMKLVNQCKNLIWLTRGGTTGVPSSDLELVTGLARVARAERQDFTFVTLSFAKDEPDTVVVEKCIQVFSSADMTENSFRIENGMSQISRLVPATYLDKHVKAQTGISDAVAMTLESINGRGLSLQVAAQGKLDGLAFGDDPLVDVQLDEHDVEFKTMAVGIDSQDLDTLLAKTEEFSLGLEASGIVTRVGSASRFQVGDRVFGLSLSGSVKTLARTTDELLAKIPENISWEDAASLPAAYLTAYAILHELGAIDEGDTILISAATSAVSQALIQMALSSKAEVFTTVENENEREIIQQTFGIPRTNILANRTQSLRTAVHRATNGRGIDIVVNSLPGEMLKASCECVAPFGRLVFLGSGDADAKENLCINKLNRNIRFESFNLRTRTVYDTKRTQKWFQRMVNTIFNNTEPPKLRIAAKTYSFAQVQDAFQQLQSDKNLDKVVLKADHSDTILVVPSKKPTSHFRHDATYVIAGGLGGLGRSIARWMAARGAKNLILLSRRGPTQSAARELIAELDLVCDKVAAPACDLTHGEAFKKVINECLVSMPPIKGCIQGSMVLKDNLLEHMSFEDWDQAVRSKVDTSLNLQAALGNDLDFFILLSSTVGITGNPEQANYAAGNTFQDAFARDLVSRGVPAVCLDLPVIRGVGFVAEKPELMEYMQSTGWASIDQDEFYSVLDFYCHPQTTSFPLLHAQVIPRFWLPQETAAEGYQLPPWRHDPLFSHLFETKAATTSKATTKKTVNHAALLAAATSMEAAEATVLEALLLKLSRVLSVEVSHLDAARPLHAYGVDSLVAVELRSWLFKELGAEVSVFDITNKPSIRQLAIAAAAKSRLTPKFE